MKKYFKQKMIAACGMNCGVCKAYLRGNNPCHGCREAEKNMPKTRVNCKMRICRKRKGDYCCDCLEFPCERLIHLDNRYRIKYSMSQIENLNYIKKHGIEKFLEKEEKRWLSAKGIYCVHDKKYYRNDKL